MAARQGGRCPFAAAHARGGSHCGIEIRRRARPQAARLRQSEVSAVAKFGAAPITSASMATAAKITPADSQLDDMDKSFAGGPKVGEPEPDEVTEVTAYTVADAEIDDTEAVERRRRLDKKRKMVEGEAAGFKNIADRQESFQFSRA